MPPRVSTTELHRIGQTPLASFADRENLGLILGNPSELAHIVLAAGEAQPPRIDVLEAVHRASMIKVATHAANRNRRSRVLARQYLTVARQARTYMSA